MGITTTTSTTAICDGCGYSLDKPAKRKSIRGGKFHPGSLRCWSKLVPATEGTLRKEEIYCAQCVWDFQEILRVRRYVKSGGEIVNLSPIGEDAEELPEEGE